MNSAQQPRRNCLSRMRQAAPIGTRTICPFMFSQRNPARTALLTANWERPEKLKDLLAPRGCGYHYARALDLFRFPDGGRVQISSLAEPLAPLSLYRLDHGDPPFLKQDGRA